MNKYKITAPIAGELTLEVWSMDAGMARSVAISHLQRLVSLYIALETDGLGIRFTYGEDDLRVEEVR